VSQRVLTLELDGEVLEIPVHVRAQARRMILRFDPRTHRPQMTCPPGTPVRSLERFLHDSRLWLAAEWLARPPAPEFAPGMSIPFLGTDHALVCDPSAPRGVVLVDDQMRVGGPADMAQRRVTDFMRREAKARLTPLVHHAADQLGAGGQVTQIRFTDTTSRWGSCSAKGIIRLNWRLVMAPEPVMAYVAAHEAAHLLEMNHSQRFWAHVTRIYGDWKPQRRWLRSEAARQLMLLPIGRSVSE